MLHKKAGVERWQKRNKEKNHSLDKCYTNEMPPQNMKLIINHFTDLKDLCGNALCNQQELNAEKISKMMRGVETHACNSNM